MPFEAFVAFFCFLGLITLVGGKVWARNGLFCPGLPPYKVQAGLYGLRYPGFSLLIVCNHHL